MCTNLITLKGKTTESDPSKTKVKPEMLFVPPQSALILSFIIIFLISGAFMQKINTVILL